MLSYLIFGSESADNGAGETIDNAANATKRSRKISLRDGQTVSIHMQWTGTPTSTMTLWYSNKPKPVETTDDDWVQDTTFPAVNPAGSASKSFNSISLLTARHIRVKCVTSGGSGTLLGWATIARGV